LERGGSSAVGRDRFGRTDHDQQHCWDRPKLTWMEGIRGLMGEKGLVEEDWNDRDEWREKIL
jgi:hypothetical protein